MTINIQIGGANSGATVVNQGNGNATAIGDGATATVRYSALDENLSSLLTTLQTSVLKADAGEDIATRLDAVIETLKEQAQAPVKNPSRLRAILGELKHLAEYIIAADIVHHYAGWIGNFLDKLKP